MSEQNVEKDRFWLYIGGTVFVLIAIMFLVKQSESEKFAPIKQQAQEETAQMNIRVLGNDRLEK